MELNATTPLRELMALDPRVLDILAQRGLACGSCLGAEFETLDDACRAHDLDVERLLEQIRQTCSEQ